MLYYCCEVELLLLLLAAAVFYHTICRGAAVKVEISVSILHLCSWILL